MAPVEAGIPSSAARSRRRRRRSRRGRGDPHHRHRAQGGRATVDLPAHARPSAAWPRARRCSRRRWPRCSPCSPPTPPSSPGRCSGRSHARSTAASTRWWSTAARAPTTPCSCSRTAPPATSRSTPRARATTRSSMPSPRRARPRRSRWRRRRGRDQARHASRCAAPAPTPRRGSRRAPVADSQLVQCSLYGERPVLGPGALGARRERRAFDPEQRRHRLQRRSSCAATASPPRTTPPRSPRRWPGATSTIDCDLARRQRRGDVLTHRPHPRLHRREHGHVVSRQPTGRRPASKARRPRRGAAVHPRVHRARRSSSSTAATPWTTPRSPTCSRRTSCSCASSA